MAEILKGSFQCGSSTFSRRLDARTRHAHTTRRAGLATSPRSPLDRGYVSHIQWYKTLAADMALFGLSERPRRARSDDVGRRHSSRFDGPS
jgi:hypothetical protein